MNPIVLSIPVFFLLIGIEIVISKLKKSGLYRLNDTTTNISCGITQQVSGVFMKTAVYAGYFYLYQEYRIASIPDNALTWIGLFIGIDFCYYWFHRYAHEISLFWGTHIVHHQSEEYNFSVALRQSTFQAFVSNIFYLPLAIIGFNPFSFLLINAFQTLYQFWLHTRTIGKLPAWFEYLFNTPSHHRVHHGINPEYIDKNHGGTLIIFDRMFGTFQEEKEAVVYGVTRQLGSWNPIWANFDYYWNLGKNMSQTKNLKDKLLMLFKKPGWQPEYLGGPQFAKEISPEMQLKYDRKVATGLNNYILSQYTLLLGITTFYLISLSGNGNTSGLHPISQFSGAIFVLVSVLSIGGLFESKKWALLLEIFRLISFPLIVFWFPFPEHFPLPAVFISCLYPLIFIPWLLSNILPDSKRS